MNVLKPRAILITSFFAAGIGFIGNICVPGAPAYGANAVEYGLITNIPNRPVVPKKKDGGETGKETGNKPKTIIIPDNGPNGKKAPTPR